MSKFRPHLDVSGLSFAWSISSELIAGASFLTNACDAIVFGVKWSDWIWTLKGQFHIERRHSAVAPIRWQPVSITITIGNRVFSLWCMEAMQSKWCRRSCMQAQKQGAAVTLKAEALADFPLLGSNIDSRTRLDWSSSVLYCNRADLIIRYRDTDQMRPGFSCPRC